MTKAHQPYRDSSGLTLEDYPRPSVAVDTAVLTLHQDTLCVLLVTNEAGDERLPGTFLHPGETLTDAAARALRDKAGVEARSPRQLHVFDDPKRDDRGWVLSVAHLDVIRVTDLRLSEHARLVAVDDLPPLKYDHAEIVQRAVHEVKGEYRGDPDPWHLLPDSSDGFTIRDLRLLHAAVLGERLVADTFRRAMLPALSSTGELRKGALGKPAELYRRS